MNYINTVVSLYFFYIPLVCSISVYNGKAKDLWPLYESSQENNENENSERVWLLLEDIQGLASLLIKNVSQICPLNQPAFLQRTENIVLSTLAEIYENEEILWKKLFYENIIPPVRATLEACVGSTRSKISLEEYSRQDYPETIFHFDLKNRFDMSKWEDFRPCIRMQMKTNFYPNRITSVIDTLWQSFLLGYLGCSDFWVSMREWNFLDLVEEVIIRPLYQRWTSKFPVNDPIPTERSNSSTTTPVPGTTILEILDVLNQTEKNSTGQGQMSLEAISSWLEKCNVILFLKHSIDPIPCFKDVFHLKG